MSHVHERCAHVRPHLGAFVPSAVHATFPLETISFCHGKLEHMRGISLVAFAIFERRRGHVGHEKVRCQRRHPFIACEISSGRRTDVPAVFVM